MLRKRPPIRQAYTRKLRARLGIPGPAKGTPQDPMPTFEMPAFGSSAYVRAHEDWPAFVSRLIDVDLESLEDEYKALYLQKYTYPGTVIAGDVHLNGPSTSRELVSRNGAKAEDREGYTVVLGDLTVDGAFEVVQDHDVFVAGSVRTHCLMSNSANLVASGEVVARDLIWLEISEEGGWLRGSSVVAPMMVLYVDGEGPQYRPDLAQLVELDSSSSDDLSEAVRRAIAQLSPDQDIRLDPHMFAHVRALVLDGKATALREAIGL